MKKLFNALDMDENKFIKEVACLTRVKHRNIVRFLGYCADTKGKMLNHEGKIVIADERQRLLCFEFLPAGSLDNYITGIPTLISHMPFSLETCLFDGLELQHL